MRRLPAARCEAVVRVRAEAARRGRPELAAFVGVAEATLRSWIDESRAPSELWRGVLLARLEIPLSAWSEAPRDAQASEPPRVAQAEETPADVDAPAPLPASPRVPVSVLDEVDALVARVRRIGAQLDEDAAMSPREQAALLTASTSALRLASSLSGDSLDWNRFLRSDQWRAIHRAIDAVCAEHPAAAALFAAAMNVAPACDGGRQ